MRKAGMRNTGNYCHWPIPRNKQEAHSHWQKTKIKNLDFLLFHLHCQKNPITCHFYGKKSTCAKKKPRISFWLFGKVVRIHVWLLAAFDHSLCTVLRRPWVIPRKVTSHVTKNPIKLGRGERAFTLAKKTVKKRKGGVSKKHLWRWVFRFRFFAVFRGSCLATSNKKWNVRKTRGFFMPV